MDHDLPDREEIACALDVLEVRLARQGQYDQAADVNSARRLLRAADEEIAAKDARIAELEIAIDRLQILGHSAFQGGWQRVAEMMSDFDAIVTASIGDDRDARMAKRIPRSRGEFHAAQGARAALAAAREAREGGRDCG